MTGWTLAAVAGAAMVCVMIDLLPGLVGGAIILAVALDVFRSLLVPRASGRWLRVGPALNVVLFAAWHAIASRMSSPRRRQTVRASFAPLMLVLIMAVWAGSLILGFGLIFWVDRSSFDPRFQSLGDALYAAGSAFSTLGITGTVHGGLTRLSVLTCSVAGLALVTVVATFLISIQSAFGRRETLVLRLESLITLPPAGIAILETYAAEGIVERIGAFFDAWEHWTAELNVSHRAFPILIFFRSNDSRCEWLAAFGAVLDAAALLETNVRDAPAEAYASARFLLRTGSRTLHDMARKFGGREDGVANATRRERFEAHRDRLAAAGYVVDGDAVAGFQAFEQRRDAYASAMSALDRRLHIDVDDRTGSQADSRPR